MRRDPLEFTISHDGHRLRCRDDGGSFSGSSAGRAAPAKVVWTVEIDGESTLGTDIIAQPEDTAQSVAPRIRVWFDTQKREVPGFPPGLGSRVGRAP